MELAIRNKKYILYIMLFSLLVYLGCSRYSANKKLKNNKKPKITNVKNIVSIKSLKKKYNKNTEVTIKSLATTPKSGEFYYLVSARNIIPTKQKPYSDMLINNKIYSSKSVFINLKENELGSEKIYVFSTKQKEVAFDLSSGLVINKKGKNKLIYKTKNIIMGFSWNPKNSNEVLILLRARGDNESNREPYSVIFFNTKNKSTDTILKTFNEIDEIDFFNNGKEFLLSVYNDKTKNFELIKKNLRGASQVLLKSNKSRYASISISPNNKWLAFIDIESLVLNLFNIESKKVYRYKRINNILEFDNSISWISNNKLLLNSSDGIWQITLNY